jgi:hypothetical protein
MGHFAELFVLKDLTPFSLRANRERRFPPPVNRPTKPPASAAEKRLAGPPFYSEKP